MPVLLLFNDADEEFPAHATILFLKNAVSYLNMEYLAMFGDILTYLLRI